jgi:hypothetical protein
MTIKRILKGMGFVVIGVGTDDKHKNGKSLYRYNDRVKLKENLRSKF